MQNVLTSISLTDKQKEVLVKVFSAPTPMLGYKETINGEQSIAASKILSDLGFIQFDGAHAIVTDSGKASMKEENLIDDSEQLTQVGNQLKSKSGTGPATAPPPPAQPTAKPNSPSDTDGGSDILADLPTLESFDLISDLNKRIRFKV